MEIEKPVEKGYISPSFPSTKRHLNRAKTALRISYETEIELIRKKIGSIDEVREGLGLSRRKMCQLLLVDPSAWTRWGKNPNQIPPHIYRSLQWYLALIEKHPEWHPKNTYLGAFGETQYQMKKIEERWEKRLEKLSQLKSNSETEEIFMDSQMESQISSMDEKTRLLGQQLEMVGQSQKSWRLLLIANTAILLIILLWLLSMT